MGNGSCASIPFLQRHIGPSAADQQRMLAVLGLDSLEQLIEGCVPSDIRLRRPPDTGTIPPPVSEHEALAELARLMGRNQLLRSLIGQGYYGTAVPPVLQRHVFENPAWYTAYTPYQAEIAQGRLEALLNFQTLVSELTGLPIANASLLDEATAAAEAMSLSCNVSRNLAAKRYLVDADVFPQTLAVLRTRAEPLGIDLVVASPEAFVLDDNVFGMLLQLPDAKGRLTDPRSLCAAARAAGVVVAMAIDPLAQVLMAPVGTLGADIAVGSAQRFGVPMGFGGPHAAFFATQAAFKRQVPGRIVGLSVDAEANPALRLALQTREQHIRRDRATSNICTAQVLLAVMASFYAAYHGSEGLTAIARHVRRHTQALAAGLAGLGDIEVSGAGFDSLRLRLDHPEALLQRAERAGFNFFPVADGSVGISLDELTGAAELEALLTLLADGKAVPAADELLAQADGRLQSLPEREGPWLRQEAFRRYRSETEMLRYIQRLASRDLSLVHGMIPLGSCTMKLNGAAELMPVSWPLVSQLHPFVPPSQLQGYAALLSQLQDWLAELTGFAAVTLQPNAGSQGEYAGLLVIRAYHASRGEGQRNICLIPTSAHGTNPASAVMAGLQVMPVCCDGDGNVDLDDLAAKAALHADRLAALMVTYPSTHGVFEPGIRRICAIVHDHGGQVYLDGANLNAQVELCRPGDYGADVCHLNLHKTFCIPHGGGGPGVGPIAVAAHLAPFLPGHPLMPCGGAHAISAVSAAPYGSASILPISWMYIRLMGLAGLRQASAVALLSANYIARRLQGAYAVLYRGTSGLVAHECILDLRQFRSSAGVEVDDLAKRLMDYGFHAPTVSWPVAGTVMVEPTESESLRELDRFCDAMLAIRAEVQAIADGTSDPRNNPLRRAPHTLAAVTANSWDRPYTRQQAAFPAGQDPAAKVWPTVARIDNAFGDRNLICSCPPMEDVTMTTVASPSPYVSVA